MELEFSGQYDKPDYFKAISWIYRPSRLDVILRVAAFVVFAAVYAYLVVTALQEDSVSTSEFSRIARHLFTFLILGYLVFQPYLRSYQTASRLWSDPAVRRTITGRASPMGVQIDPSGDWMAWGDFVKTYKSGDLVVLLTAARLFVILPRTFFRDDSDWKMLHGMLATRVKEAQ